MDAFHYVVAIAGYVGAGAALLVAIMVTGDLLLRDLSYLEALSKDEETLKKKTEAQTKAAILKGVALVSALVLALLSSILIRLIE